MTQNARSTRKTKEAAKRGTPAHPPVSPVAPPRREPDPSDTALTDVENATLTEVENPTLTDADPLFADDAEWPEVVDTAWELGPDPDWPEVDVQDWADVYDVLDSIDPAATTDRDSVTADLDGPESEPATPGSEEPSSSPQVLLFRPRLRPIPE